MQRSRRVEVGPRGGLANFRGKKKSRIIVAVVAAVAAVVAVTAVANASTWRRRPPPPPCATAAPTAAPTTAPTTGAPAPSASEGADPNAGGVPAQGQTEGTVSGGRQNGHDVRNHVGDGQGGTGSRNGGNCTTPTTGTTKPVEPFLGDDCSNSTLAAHDGFQLGNRCVGTEFGEVGNADKNPTLLITTAPQRVRANQAFTIRVSTRNLVRDRFLPAGTGGYYKERSFLTAEGLVRGHFHTACRMLSTTRGAPDPAPVPAFFVATEDGGGSGNADVITINVSGMPTQGIAQCAAWAGDASHRIPMMQRANQIPAFDSVRIVVV